MTIQNIKNKIASQRSLLEQKYHIQKLGIFGSVACGRQRAGSDVDIAVEFGSPIGFFDFIRLEKFLADLLETEVDLVSIKAIKPVIKDDILKEIIYV